MRKEVLAAIITGIVFGVVVAFGVWRANVAFKPENQASQTQTSSPTPQPTVSENAGITIAKPEKNQVLSESPTKISGLTKKGSWVVISAEEEDYIFKNQENGEFEQEIALVAGANQIVISAFDEEGVASKDSLIVYFSSEFAPQEIPTPSQEKTDESVSEKIQEKLQERSTIPMGYLGTITDIAETTAQIKTLSGEIRQVTVSQQTTYAKINKTTKKIEFADVAIGDFIIAMGYKDENDVLDTRRLLVTKPISQTGRSTLLTKVLEVKKNELVVQSTDSKQISLVPIKDVEIVIDEDGKLKSIEFEDIGIGDTIIGVETEVEGKFEARTIRVVEKAPAPSPTSPPTPAS